MKSLRIGCGLIILGIIPIVTLLFSFGNIRSDPEISSGEAQVPAGEMFVIEVEAKEGRYDYRLSSDEKVDFFLITRDQFEVYKNGEEFIPVNQVMNVTYWETFIQTGSGGSFGVGIENIGDELATVDVVQFFFSNPKNQTILIIASFIGLLILIIGAIISFISILIINLI